MRRAFSSTLLLSAVLLGGCPGELQNPERFEGVPACRGNIDVPRLFEEKCGSSVCHGGTSTDPAGGLDLTSPGVARRLVGVPAQGCGGLYRVDPHDPDNSFLLGKLIEPPAGCGDRMPLVGVLSVAELACVRSWVHSIASGDVVIVTDAGTKPSDAGADAGGSVDAGETAPDAGSPTDAGSFVDAGSPMDASLPFDAGSSELDSGIDDGGTP
jgi:hypothetical protein